MKIICYKALIKQEGTDQIWNEEFSDLVVDNMTALRHCQFLIEHFNNTLRPGEYPRIVISVRPVKNTAHLENTVHQKHLWKKMSLVTEKGLYDKYRCELCGATGKRYGLIEFVTPDRKFTIYCK